MGLYRLYVFFFFQETLNLSEKLELHNKVDFDNSLPLQFVELEIDISLSVRLHRFYISTYYQCPKKDRSRRSTKRSLLGYMN